MVYAPAFPIETERLRLRPFSRGDVDAVYAYRRLDEVARYLFDETMDREAVTEVVQARIGHTALVTEGDKIFLAVELREGHSLIGEVTLILRSDANRQAEIGYIFHPDFQGRGYATGRRGSCCGWGLTELACTGSMRAAPPKTSLRRA